METNLNRVATDLIDKIGDFPNLEYKDRDNQSIPPTMDDQIENARIFDFNFARDGIDFGPVTITIGDQDGLQIKTYSDPVEGKSNREQDIWYDFIKSMSEFATEHVIKFKGPKIVTKKIMPKTEVGESKMTESKLVGTSKTSYQDLGEATLIVKHTRPINYDAANGRTQHIESIFIENAAGERFRYPYKHLNGARALATHIIGGGTPYDDVGQYMIGLSEELNKLRMFKGYVTRSPMVSEAMGAVTDKVFERIEGIKKEIHSLQSKKYYAEWVEGFNKAESKEIPEDVKNEWIDRLTIKTFNEELTSVFPYLFNFIEESDLPTKNISAEDILGSIQQVQEFNEPDREIQELIDLENFVDNIVKEDADTGIFSNDPTAVETAVAKLNELVAENPDATLGLSGENGKKLIAEVFGSDELMKEIEDRADQGEGSNTPLWPLVQAYLEFKAPEMLSDNGGAVNFNPEPQAAPPEAAPEPTPAAAEPAPAAAPVEPQPQQEGWQSGLEQRLGKIKSLAEQSGRDFDSISLNINGKSYSLSEALSAFNLDEGAKWRDPKYKDKFYTQDPVADDEDDFYNDSDYYGKSRPENDPGKKQRMGGIGSEFGDNDDPMSGRYTIRKTHMPHEFDGEYTSSAFSTRGPRKGMITKQHGRNMKDKIRGSLGTHNEPNLPEGEEAQSFYVMLLGPRSGQRDPYQGPFNSPEEAQEWIDTESHDPENYEVGEYPAGQFGQYENGEPVDNSPPWDTDDDEKSNFKKPSNPNRTGRDSARALAQRGQAQAKKKSLAQEIQEMVKSFTNLVPERMDQGPFPLGEEGVVTKVTKDMCEKFGKEDDERFKMAVETYCRETVGKLGSVYETYRMKKLAGMDAEMEEGSIQNGVWVASPDTGVPAPSPNEGPTSNVRPVKPGTTPEKAKLDPRYKTDPNFKREVDAAMQITSGPNKGKPWTPSTPGPTNPNFKPNIKGVPQDPDGGSAPPPGYRPAKEEIARIRELSGLR